MTLLGLPPPAVGKHLTIFQAVGQIAGPDGTLTADSTVYNIVAAVDEYDFEENPQKEDCAPMSMPQANHIIYREDWSLTVNEILVDTTDASSPVVSSKLLALANAFAVVQLTWTYSGNTFTFTGTRGRISRQGRAGKNIVAVTFDHYAIEAGNPTYA